MTLHDVVMFAIERLGELLCLGLVGMTCMGFYEGWKIRRERLSQGSNS